MVCNEELCYADSGRNLDPDATGVEVRQPDETWGKFSYTHHQHEMRRLARG